MKAFPEKIVVYDDELENTLFTVTGVDQDIIEMTAKSLWLSTEEEIDDLCTVLKNCLRLYEGGL